MTTITPATDAARTYEVRTYGCQMNVHDSERLSGLLEGAALAKLRADVGMVFQSFNLFAHRTILDNVALAPIKVRGMKKADAEA
ncbi:MAG: glutamate transport system ATP-binding protein, partial [Cryptosporangiaceae bacterium]|nr:glutamate transport system ATP-binding protein [Cryptosporangiaceae bacterium]